MSIKFGTDGWRAVISDEFTFENVRKVAQAIADLVIAKSGSPQPAIVVGFDTRFLSDRYAREVAKVLAGNGIKVYLSKGDVPTPMLSYAVVHMHADGGVMITASHNPPRYNGIKLKAAYGGSASPEDSEKVVEYLHANEQAGREPAMVSFGEGEESGLIVRFDPYPPYREHISSLIDFDRLAGRRMRVLIDPMYGAGRGYLKRLLREAGMEADEIHGGLNPGFGGLHPEPIARYLGELIDAVPSGGWDLGLANDGDADRIGAVSESGRFVDPHRIMSLALRYLVEERGKKGAVVKTISTTQALNVMAGKYGIPIYETPVGFNYIADYMINDDVLIGGEESGGISIEGHIPEGDGILMGLLIAEIMAYHGVGLDELLASLAEEFGEFHYGRNDLRVPPFSKKELVETLVSEAPGKLAGVPVREINSMDGVKYILDDDSWLLIRPSGTEPVLRIYAEARTPDRVPVLLREGAKLAHVED